MKWVSLAIGLLGVVVLFVVGRFWHELLDSNDFKLIFLFSQISDGTTAASDRARDVGAGLLSLRAVSWACYSGAVLSIAGIGLVVTRGRVAAIPLFVAAVLPALALGRVVLSIPELSPYLYAGFAGAPSGLAGLIALAVRGKGRAAAQGAQAPAEPSPAGDARRKKRLWAVGIAAASLCLLLVIWVASSGKSEASDDEVLFYPDPVALSSVDLIDLGDVALQPGQLLAAEWRGAWYAGRVLSAGAGGARVRFVGWGSEWDEQLPSDRLRIMPEHLAFPTPGAGKGNAPRLGTSVPTPCALVLSLYQPSAGLAGSSRLRDLPAKQTLYTPRLDLANASLEGLLAGSTLDASKPFALAATGTVRVDEAGPHFFEVESNGKTELWIDGKVVASGTPLQLEAGAHELRLEHRHDSGSSLTLRLRTGTKPGALRPLDLGRDGVAQYAREADGGWRLVLDESLLFDFDRSELKAEAERALSSIYALSLAPVPGAPVEIEGHTDDKGASAYNRDLSRRRAETVRGWLTAHGRTSSLRIQAYGETRPRVPNDTDAHRKLNRRVELVIGPDNGDPAPRENAPAVVAAAPGTATNAAAPNAAPDAAANSAASAQPSGDAAPGVLGTLQAYYRELNDGTFDANRYFEPSVNRYITMMNTSTTDINHYIRNIFPKQFKQHHFELEEGSLSAQSPTEYVYVEHSRYIQAGKQNSVEKRVKVRVLLSPAGKLVSLHQFQRL